MPERTTDSWSPLVASEGIVEWLRTDEGHRWIADYTYGEGGWDVPDERYHAYTRDDELDTHDQAPLFFNLKRSEHLDDECIICIRGYTGEAMHTRPIDWEAADWEDDAPDALAL